MKNIDSKIKDFEIIIVKVDEPIHKNHIKEFIYTSISLNKKSVNRKNYIAYFYISQISSYEIIIYKDEKHPFLLMHAYFMKNPTNEQKVLIFDDLLLLYKNAKLYYIQKNDYELSKDEISQLVYKKFSIIVNSIEFLTHTDIEKIKIDKKQINKSINIIKKNNYNYTSAYIFYTLFSFSLISFYIYENNFSKEKLQKRVLEKERELKILLESKKRELEIVNLVDIMKNIKNSSLELIELTFEQKNYSLILENSDEKKLYLFVNLYPKKIKIKKLQYIKERQKYELHVQIANY